MGGSGSLGGCLQQHRLHVGHDVALVVQDFERALDDEWRRSAAVDRRNRLSVEPGAVGNLLSWAGDGTGFDVGDKHVVPLVATSELEQWAYGTADDARFLRQLAAGGVAQCFTAMRLATRQHPASIEPGN